jgi:DNA-binding transcriptional MerR regulator
MTAQFDDLTPAQQAAADAADLALAARVRAARHAGFSHEQVVAAIDALDRADQAASPAEAEAILRQHAGVLDAATAAGRETDEAHTATQLANETDVRTPPA